ncbi:hypothetical protein CBF90_05835 [Microbacterium sp. AISO3]|nr:hypothetical protein CBF90_05835 [Microbacterium sp. AISO3]
MSTMKLQKLCYIAQGWSLALRDDPLFAGDFEAWKNGPVSPQLYRQHRRSFSVSSWPSGDPDALSADERIILDAVLTNYEALTGLQLSAMTHEPGTPWSETRRIAGVSDGESSDEPIPNDLIREHYRALLGVRESAQQLR